MKRNNKIFWILFSFKKKKRMRIRNICLEIYLEYHQSIFIMDLILALVEIV